MIGYLSAGIGRIRCLEALLNSPCRKIGLLSRPDSFAAVAGWGLKPTAEPVRRYASRHGLQYISLEDGFLRSLGLGVHGALIHSLIVDHEGVYYDASKPCDLENQIRAVSLDPREKQRAGDALDLLRRYRLSKYNHADDRPPATVEGNRPRVLVVDQTLGDASIEYGQGSRDLFEQMLLDAVQQNPDVEVLVKVHPDVLAGRKQGYLLDLASRYDCRLIGEDLSPWALLDLVETVYVVTSQMGFEALIAGKAVHCYGMPFYAGWGLTQDRLSCPRRGVNRTLEEVFTAAYLHYCRYINPYTGARCEFEDTAALIADQRRARDLVAGEWLALDFAGWKRPFIARFLGKQQAQVGWKKISELTSVADRRVLAWASKVTGDLVETCNSLGAELWRIEDGFIRSVGLGVDLVVPMSLVLDSRGIYYDATGPSDLEYMLEHRDVSADLLRRAAALRKRLTALKLSKYNVGSAKVLELPRGRRLILVPGQVETDASIRYGSPDLKTNRALLEAVRRDNPDAFVIYKPHPDVVGGGRIGEVEGADLYDLEVRDIAMPDLLEQVDEVHTLTSLTGFEALLREIPVTTYGLPFYAGWGLTDDRLSCSRRTRTRSLDELVAATLILYPLYVDPKTGEHVNADTAIELLAKQRASGQRPNLRTRLWRLIRKRI